SEANLPATLMENDLSESGCVFITFDEVYAGIEKYTARTHAVLILRKIFNIPDGNSYRQVICFVCK
ncbi:15457_t:CDS:1, partial [Gigaspora rosea]